MSKLFECILYGILILLFFTSVVYASSLVRSHPQLPVTFLQLICVLSFLFSRVPDFFRHSTLPTVLKYHFYCSLVVSGLCLLSYSKGKADIEKLFFEGKVSSYAVDVDAEQGQGVDTIYHLDNVPPATGHLIGVALIVLIAGIPYFVYRLWQKAVQETS